MKPLFIFSLPRSGSTLLQRVLAADKQISTVAEPWLLLPFIYALREKGVRSEYWHYWSNLALKEFINELPNGRQDYLSAIGIAVRELYIKASGDNHAIYFLDKTPRYTLIIDEIINAFPDGKFIFLWRNPLSVITSIVETWAGGRWDLSTWNIDLFKGMENMIACYKTHSDKVLSIHYEELLKQPNIELSKISDYLDIKINPDVFNEFSRISINSHLGDSTGIKKYKKIDVSPINKWKLVINNPLRKRWSKRYLLWIGEHRLQVIGNDINDLIAEIDTCGLSIKSLFLDLNSILSFKNISIFIGRESYK